MDYIRKARDTEPDWRDDLRHCLYGPDADLIVLNLVPHEKHVRLLCETTSVRHSHRKKPKDPITFSRNDFYLMAVSPRREMHFKAQANDPQPSKFELERVIDDFVFVCVLVGNGSLPNIPHFDISCCALNHMMNMHKVLLSKMGGLLTKENQIHLAGWRYLCMRDRYNKPKLDLELEQEEEKRLVVQHFLESLY